MGCACTVPKVVESPMAYTQSYHQRTHRRISQNFQQQQQQEQSHHHHHHRQHSSKGHSKKSSKKHKAKSAISIYTMLDLAQITINDNFKGLVDPIMLAALALTESYGEFSSCHFDEDLKESIYGLCQISLRTAGFLKNLGFDKYGTMTKENLLIPQVSLYFGASYLKYLFSTHFQESHSEELIIRNYFNKNKKNENYKYKQFWHCYIKAKSQLTLLEKVLKDQKQMEDDTVIHIVKAGETFENIAKICRIRVQDILDISPYLSNIETLCPGDCIGLPAKSLLPRFHMVKPSESMATIARHYEVTLLRLIKYNEDVRNPSNLKPGWILTIPGLKDDSFNENSDKFDLDILIPSGFQDSFEYLAITSNFYIDDENYNLHLPIATSSSFSPTTNTI